MNGAGTWIAIFVGAMVVSSGCQSLCMWLHIVPKQVPYHEGVSIPDMAPTKANAKMEESAYPDFTIDDKPRNC